MSLNGHRQAATSIRTLISLLKTLMNYLQAAISLMSHLQVSMSMQAAMLERWKHPQNVDMHELSGQKGQGRCRLSGQRQLKFATNQTLTKHACPLAHSFRINSDGTFRVLVACTSLNAQNCQFQSRCEALLHLINLQPGLRAVPPPPSTTPALSLAAPASQHRTYCHLLPQCHFMSFSASASLHIIFSLSATTPHACTATRCSP
eukprot:1157426-Pelagomonas_calceolata.AAC.7